MKLKDLKIKYYKGKPPRIKEGASLLAYLTPDFIRKGTLPEYFPVQPGVVCVEDNDLILLWDGSNAGEFFRAKKGILSSTMVKFDKIEKATEEYFYYSLKLQEQKLKSKTAGSGIPHVDKEALLNLEVYLPEKPQQAIIATILTTIDQAIEKTERLIAKYERIKTGLMQDLLTRGIDEQGNIRSEKTHRFKDSPLGRIPFDWDLVPLSSIATIARGKFTHRPRNEPKFYGGEHPFIQTGDVSNCKSIYLNRFTQTLNHLGIRISKSFPKGTIVITIAANIGDTAILEREMYLTDSVIGIYSEKSNPLFLNFILKSYKGYLNNVAATQSAQKNINLETLKPLLIPYPSVEEQEIIAEIISRNQTIIDEGNLQLEKLKRIKTALMQDLLTGKVRVESLIPNQV